MSDALRPNVDGVTLADAHTLAIHHNDQFKGVAKAVERMPAHSKFAKRKRRGMRAIAHLRTAIFWRVIYTEHPTQPPTARVGHLLGPREIDALWREAAERARLAAREGAVKPGRLGRALRVASEYVPGQGDLPRRAV